MMSLKILLFSNLNLNQNMNKIIIVKLRIIKIKFRFIKIFKTSGIFIKAVIYDLFNEAYT